MTHAVCSRCDLLGLIFMMTSPHGWLRSEVINWLAVTAIGSLAAVLVLD